RQEARDDQRGRRADQGSRAGESGASPRERDPAASLGFLCGGARPPTQQVVSFIDANRDELGVEPICKALQVAPSSYYSAKQREIRPCARALRDAVLMQVLMALWVANHKVYGAHKLKAAIRADHDIGRDQVARLMRQMGICGVSRRRKVFTTR